MSAYWLRRSRVVAGNLNAWKLQRLLTACRIFAYHTPNESTGTTFLEYDRMTTDCYTFMASTRTVFMRSLFDLAKLNRMPKLEVLLHLGYIGMSSLNSVAQLKNRDTDEVYVENTNQVVTVSKQTRKPTPLPDWWKEQYEAAVVEDQRLIVQPITALGTVHTHSLKVAWDDIDGYHHTNYVAYIKYCFEAAMDACVSGIYSKIKDDILQYHVKSMEIAYKGETKAADELDIETWEDENDPYQLHFIISKNGTTVFQNTVSFFNS